MTDQVPPDKLNVQFGIPQTLRFEAGPRGLTRAVITADAAMAVIYLHGAHVAEYEPTGRKGVLFLSQASDYQPGRPIRGGVPICFPWFGEKAGAPAAPMHGLARLQSWDVTAAEREDDRVRLELTTTIQAFRITHRIVVGPTLSMTLLVEHTGHVASSFEQALHTYFAVSDVRQIEVTGLENSTYLDKPSDFQRLTQGDEPIRFTGEVDRVYTQNPATCVLHDPGAGRRIVVAKQNANSTIVWNPGEEKAAEMSDFGDQEWSQMVCIESGNVKEDQLNLEPGEQHEMSAEIRVEPMG